MLVYQRVPLNPVSDHQLSNEIHSSKLTHPNSGRSYIRSTSPSIPVKSPRLMANQWWINAYHYQQVNLWVFSIATDKCPLMDGKDDDLPIKTTDFPMLC